MDTPIVPPLKRCTKCHRELPATLEYFGAEKRTSIGLQSECRECHNKRSAEYVVNNYDLVTERRKKAYAADPSRQRARTKKYEQNNPERAKQIRRDITKRYREKHPEKVREQAQKRWTVHREQMREQSKQWRARNPDRVRLHIRRRRDRKANTICTFTEHHERLAVEYFHGCCAVCGRQLFDLLGTSRLDMDHWIPLSKGGQTAPNNMIPLCGLQNGCNNSKHNRDPIEWLNRHYSPREVNKILARVNGYFEWIAQQD